MKKVSIEIATLLQKAGFHEKTNSFYLAKTPNAKYELYEDGEYRDWNEECEKAVYNAVMSAPTLLEVCDWLRENKNMKVWVEPDRSIEMKEIETTEYNFAFWYGMWWVSEKEIYKSTSSTYNDSMESIVSFALKKLTENNNETKQNIEGTNLEQIQ